MSIDEFMKSQYLTLREEIREGKSRIFRLLILGSLLVPAAGFAANEFKSTFAAAAMPFIILMLMLAFITEQNGVIRAGRYLKEHVEPHIQGITGWEHWLESNHRLRDADRYFFGSFLVIFFLFYVVGTGSAINTLAGTYYEQYQYALIAYGIGGLWFLVVLIRHWHSCTTTVD